MLNCLHIQLEIQLRKTLLFHFSYFFNCKWQEVYLSSNSLYNLSKSTIEISQYHYLLYLQYRLIHKQNYPSSKLCNLFHNQHPQQESYQNLLHIIHLHYQINKKEVMCICRAIMYLQNLIHLRLLLCYHFERNTKE